MKQISILLTRYNDRMSQFVYWISGRNYTHASIALEDDPEYFYSFNYRGFTRETLEKHRDRGVKYSRCYHLQVPDAVYYKIQKKIDKFQANRKEYQYNRIGVFLCIIHMPVLKREKYYFCSEFVAEVLEESGAVELKKKPALYFPNHFVPLLEKHPRCVGIVQNMV
ncbi:MAG: hypothetical protein IKZ26_06390 [Peptococcaceae bacterium]|nr:hypothetical protein [Peptococcaceae bacterium]